MEKGKTPSSPRVKKTCSIEGCTNFSKKGGVCVRHGAKLRRCSHEGCTNQAVEGGVCLRHGANIKRCNHEGCNNYAKKGGVCIKHGATWTRQICSHAGCTNYPRKGGVCRRHGGTQTRQLCNHEECTNIAINRGVCSRHGKICSHHEGCTTYAKTGGLCHRHWKENCSSNDTPYLNSLPEQPPLKRQKSGHTTNVDGSKKSGAKKDCTMNPPRPKQHRKSVGMLGHEMNQLSEDDPEKETAKSDEGGKLGLSWSKDAEQADAMNRDLVDELKRKLEDANAKLESANSETSYLKSSNASLIMERDGSNARVDELSSEIRQQREEFEKEKEELQTKLADSHGLLILALKNAKPEETAALNNKTQVTEEQLAQSDQNMGTLRNQVSHLCDQVAVLQSHSVERSG